jgi:hypothetical protein
MMSSSFEVMLNRPESPKDNKEYDDYVVTTGAKNVEVLAGVGDLAHARVMIGRVLNYDHSEATTLALKARLERAGHPELLDELGKP